MEIIADEWWRSVERLSFDLDTEAVLTRLEMALPMLIWRLLPMKLTMTQNMLMEQEPMKISS